MTERLAEDTKLLWLRRPYFRNNGGAQSATANSRGSRMRLIIDHCLKARLFSLEQPVLRLLV